MSDPVYDAKTAAARFAAADAWSFDFGFHAGWHGGGVATDGDDAESFRAGMLHGVRQSSLEFEAV